LFTTLPRGKVLDFPAGWGQEYLHLRKLGFEVVPADQFTEFFKPKGWPCVRANGNGAFPFRNESSIMFCAGKRSNILRIRPTTSVNPPEY
jgi:hypothetical protein